MVQEKTSQAAAENNDTGGRPLRNGRRGGSSMSQDSRTRKPVRPGFILAIVVAGVILAAGASAAFRFDLLPVARAPAKRRTGDPGASRMAAIDREAAKLPRYRHHVRPLFADAMKVTSALQHGRFDRANKALERSLKHTRMSGWYYAPFTAFVEDVPLPGNPHFRKQLDQWVRQDPDAPMPYLVRALYYSQTGSRVRGTRFANAVEPAHMRAFSNDMNRALEDLGQAMRLGGDNPFTADLMLDILQSQGDSPVMKGAFRQAIGEFPGYYSLYDTRLTTLEPKWGGSVREMYAFVNKYAGKAPADSPLKMLYLDLYDDLLDTATVDCYRPRKKIEARCVRRTMQQLVTAGLDKHVYRLLNTYDEVDKADFSSMVGGLVSNMIGYDGGQRYSSAILQLAAQAMHSDTQLVADDTGHNNYVIDRLAAEVWAQRGHYDNAETLYKRAIADVSRDKFLDREGKDLALGNLYDELADVYNGTGAYREVVVYEKAARALLGAIHGGNTVEGCSALVRLKLYHAAVRTCGRQIDDGAGLAFRFWRARAYDHLGRNKAALRDYRRVAGSESHYRSSAAIDMSVVYGRTHDLHHMLSELRRYHYLYDAEHESDNNMAIAYNNRCYAEMHLGKLRAALRDCNASLRYGNLPDAYAKQQKLVRKLQAAGESTGPPSTAPTHKADASM